MRAGRSATPTDGPGPAITPSTAAPRHDRDRPPRQWRYLWAYLIAALGYSGAYLHARGAGQRFSEAFAHTGWQLAPLAMLTKDPLGASFAVHTQPPLWNLVVGITAWASPAHRTTGFILVMFCFGLAATLLATRIISLSGCRPVLAGVLGAAVGVVPTLFANGFSLNYELPVSVLLLALAAIIASRGTRLGNGGLLTFSATLTALALLRATFHPVLVVLVLVLVALMARRSAARLALLASVLVPCVLFAGLAWKNHEMIGDASLSSWTGMNMLRATATAVPQAELDRMARDGEISPIGAVSPYSEIEAYRPHMPPCRLDSATPTLVRQRYAEQHRFVAFIKQYVDIPNYNYGCYVPVYRQAGKDALVIARTHPRAFLTARIVSTRAWFSTYPAERDPAGRWLQVWQRASVDVARADTAHWSGAPYYQTLVNQPLSLPAIGAVLVVLLAALVACLGRWRSDPARRLVLFTAGTYLVYFAVCVVFEVGEQARFRTSIDQLTWVCALVVLIRLAQTVFGALHRRLAR